MKASTQKIMMVVIIVLLVAVITIQLVAKKKVVMDNGSTGTASVFGKAETLDVELIEEV